jgi:anti-sigma regulatory factor (Ser/Thr protein kinase)
VRALEEPASIALAQGPEAASTARQFVTDAAEGLAFGERRDNLELLVSELVTNAMRHAHTGCQVMLCRHGDRLRVEVDDESSQLPAMRTFPDETGGWGLRLLAALSHDWGTERRPWGKSVWFII